MAHTPPVDAAVSAFDAAALLVVVAATLGYLNYRFLKLPHTIGLTIMGALASLAVIVVDGIVPGLGIGHATRGFVRSIDFHATLMDGMLAFLLFAGALHIDFEDLFEQRWAIAAMATLGVIASTVIVGLGLWWLTLAFRLDVPLIWCFVFGALISPTDPVAVIGILKTADVPPSIEAKVAGESLFNDGIGVVVFTLFLAVATGTHEFGLVWAVELFLIEAVGGAAVGALAGYVAYRAMRTIDEHNLEVLITLALVMGGYALAGLLGLSGPVAMAVAGLFIGNVGTRYAMSDRTHEHLTRFWSLVDEMLNSVLFLLIGIEIVVLPVEFAYLAIGWAMIAVVLAARAATVALPVFGLSGVSPFTEGTFRILVWGGLRGGISVALVLSLPGDPGTSVIKDLLLTVTYMIVVFSVVVQGSTVSRLAARQRLISG